MTESGARKPHIAVAWLLTLIAGMLALFAAGLAYCMLSPVRWDRYRLLSPLTHVSEKSPPTLTILGGSDRLVSMPHAHLLQEAPRKAGVPHELVVLPAKDHAFDVNWGGFGTQIARDKVRAFLERRG